MILSIHKKVIGLLGVYLFPLIACSETTIDTFREIYPIPRVSRYQQTVVSVGSALTLQADSEFDTKKIQMMSDDVSGYLTERYGQPFKINVITTASTNKSVTIRILRSKDVVPPLTKKLFTSPFFPEKFPKGPRSRQSYIIRSFLADKTPTVYLVSESEQGAYYALFAVAQLIRWENNNFTLRGVDVIDWPAFEARFTCDMKMTNVLSPVSLQREDIVFKAGILRVTHGMSGYENSSSQRPYARDRWLRLGAGCWNRPDLKSPLSPYNWSDLSSVKGYADMAASYSSEPGLGCYTWHDATDAGWWHVYLDQFWNKRDAVDRKNYPDDPTPARADAVRFSAMLRAIEKANPDIDVFLTLPCYYDSPEDNNLPRVNLLRDYLKTIGAAVPVSMKDRVYFILEERSPAAIAAYQSYLGCKVCNFRYTPLWNGGTWDMNYTEAKRHDGRAESYYYDAAWCDLVNLLGTQYLWNPDLPTDETWIKKNLAPRAAYLAYGNAWKPMLDYFILNLNASQIQREVDMLRLKKTKIAATKAENWLTQAQQQIPERWLYARQVVLVNQQGVSNLLKIIETNLATAKQEISLTKAVIKTDAPGNGDARAAVLGKGRWISSETLSPHWVEIDLPEPYQITQLTVFMPSDGGYSWVDADVLAEVFGKWKNVAKFGKAEERPLVCCFDDVRTDKIRIVLKQPWDWSKAPRNDMQLTGIKLFGRPLPKDPPGVERLDGQWKFQLDPNKAGKTKKLFAQTDLSKDWDTIIVPSYFEESGIDGTVGYDGWVWYARNFEVPPLWKNRVVKIRFEAVDDEAEVWLNGQRIGEHRKKGDKDIHWFEEPFLFDISSVINWDRPNRLVVLVNDFTLGGGIYKSVMIHLDDGPGLFAPDPNKK